MIRNWSGLLALALLVSACGPGAAEREYLAALRGDEDGSTFDERIAHLLSAIVLAPERGRYRESRAILRIDSHDFGAALDDLDHAIELGDRKIPEEALADAERLLQLAPQVGTSWYVRGLALASLGRHVEAVTDFDESVLRMPELVYPHLDAADSYDALGDSTNARKQREVAAAGKRERSGCAYCLDPFRY